MTEHLKKELDVIVKTIADTGMASKIILFGSAAKGGENPSSDFDLCVLTPVTDKSPRDMKIEIRRMLRGIKKTPMDLLMYNQDRFAFHASRTTSFEYVINTEGVVMYEQL
jgi:predicted nucleotidyltransferase